MRVHLVADMWMMKRRGGFLQFVSIGVLYYVKGVFVRLISGRKGKLHQVTCFLIL